MIVRRPTWRDRLRRLLRRPRAATQPDATIVGPELARLIHGLLEDHRTDRPPTGLDLHLLIRDTFEDIPSYEPGAPVLTPADPYRKRGRRR